MTPAQKDIVQNTWTLVVPIADTATAMFYDRLFAIDPGSKELFDNTDLAEQRLKLLQVLSVAIAGLDDLGRLIPIVEDLGRRHAGYGVTDEHYDSVGAALLWTLVALLRSAALSLRTWLARRTVAVGRFQELGMARVAA